MSGGAAHRDATPRAAQAWARYAGPGTVLGDGARIVTPTGWGLLGGAVALAVAGRALGWGELTLAAVALGVVVVLALALVVGGAAPDLSIDLAPRRLTPHATDGPAPTSTATVTVAGHERRAQAPVTIDVPVGARTARFAVPALAAGATHHVELVVPGERRGVVTVGPATTVRTDPFGIARRVVSTADAVELFVHPRIQALPPLDSGVVRDLEGRATTDPSDSDLDFHTLRGYTPGDDRRHVHWLSSARASAASGATELMTRTYTDTRRSHLGVVVDGRPASYGDDDLFERAVEAAASVAARACADETDVTVVASDVVIDRRGRTGTLDGFARVEPGDADLADLAARLAGVAPTTSIVLLVTGPVPAFAAVRRAAAVLGAGVRVVVLRVQADGTSSSTRLPEATVLTLADAADLPRLVRAGGL